MLISPGLDMSLANPEVFEAERNDPWLGIPGGLEAVRLYSAGMIAATGASARFTATCRCCRKRCSDRFARNAHPDN